MKSTTLFVLLVVSTVASTQEKKPKLDALGDPLPAEALLRIGTQRWKHGAAVLQLAFAADGKRLVSAGRDGKVRLFDVTSGKQVGGLDPFKKPIAALAVSPDGRTIAVADDATLRLADADGRNVRSIADLKEGPTCLSFSPDGGTLAGGYVERIVLWNVAAARQDRMLRAESAVRHLAWMPDGKRLAVGYFDDGGVSIRSIVEDKTLRKFPGWMHSFVPVGKDSVLIAEHDKPLAVHDAATGKRLHQLEENKGEGPILLLPLTARAGGLVAVGCGEGNLRVFDSNTGKQLWRKDASPSAVKALAFSSDGKRTASADADGVITIRDGANGEIINKPNGPERAVLASALSPDGKLAVLAGRDGTLRVHRLDRGTETAMERQAGVQFTSVAFSPDGKTIAAGDDRGRIAMRESGTLRRVNVFEGHRGTVTALHFTDGGKNLLSAGHDRSVRQWDLNQGGKAVPVETRELEKILSLAVSTDGRRLLLADGSASPRLMTRAGGKQTVELPGHSGGCLTTVFSPSGRVAYSAGRDGRINFLETIGGKERRSVTVGAWVHVLACSADGRLLASGSAEGRIDLWDAQSGLRLRTFDGHLGAVLSLNFSTDGTRLLSTGADATALLWEVSPKSTTPKPVSLSAEQLAALWRDLAAMEGDAAAEAVQTLARAGDSAVRLIAEHVKPVTKDEIDGLIADLDAKKFAVRDRALRRLLVLGRFIEPVLREQLKTKPTLEMRRRVEDLLQAIAAEERTPEEVRVFRAFEVLEMIASPAARKLLATLADGASHCEITSEAKSTLERLNTRK